MEKYKGGYHILDLTSIMLELLEDNQNFIDIEDSKILSQLYNSLLPYVLEPQKALKPVYLRILDEDGFKSSVMGLLQKLPENTFEIIVYYNNSQITFFVSFDYDSDTNTWSIDSCNYNYVDISTLIDYNPEKTPRIYHVDDVEDIPQEILNKLKMGDVVVYDTNSYIVAYFDGNEMDLVYTAGDFITTVDYTLSGGTWTFDTTSEFNITNYVSEHATKLYKHSIQIDTNVAYQHIIIINSKPDKIKDMQSQDLEYEIISGLLLKFAAGTNAIDAPFQQCMIYGTPLQIKCMTYTDIDTKTTTTFNLSDIYSETVTPL